MRIHHPKERVVYILKLDAHRSDVYEQMHLQIHVSRYAKFTALPHTENTMRKNGRK